MNSSTAAWFQNGEVMKQGRNLDDTSLVFVVKPFPLIGQL